MLKSDHWSLGEACVESVVGVIILIMIRFRGVIFAFAVYFFLESCVCEAKNCIS